MNVQEIYNMLKEFIGYGNPSAQYWFIGMEEHWDFDCISDISKAITENDIDYYSKEIQPLTEESYTLCKFLDREKKYGTYEYGIKKIIESIIGKEIDHKFYTSFIFSTNVRFLPESLKPKIPEIFKINDIDSYNEDENKRRKKIFKLWAQNANKDRITFCLSLEYQRLFESLFSIEFNNSMQGSNIKLFESNNGEKIILMAHPASRQHFVKYLSELKALPLRY